MRRIKTKPQPKTTRKRAAELVESLRPYAIKCARTFWLPRQKYGTLEEFQAAAIFGTFIAATRFDESKGHKFVTYATWYIRSELQKWLAHAQGVPIHTWTAHPERLEAIHRTKSLDQIRGPAEAKLSMLVEARGEADRPEFPDDFWERVEKFLDQRARRVIRMRFREGLTLGEIADRLGLTRERIRQIEERALGTIFRMVDFGDCLDQFTCRG